MKKKRIALAKGIGSPEANKRVAKYQQWPLQTPDKVWELIENPSPYDRRDTNDLHNSKASKYNVS